MKRLTICLAMVVLPAVSVQAQQADRQQTPQQPTEQRDEQQQNTRRSPQDGIISLGTTVKGNQEQPKVLYIVPWQPAQDDTILYQPINGQTDSVFRHLERAEHRRHLDFLQDLGKEDSAVP